MLQWALIHIHEETLMQNPQFPNHCWSSDSGHFDVNWARVLNRKLTHQSKYIYTYICISNSQNWGAGSTGYKCLAPPSFRCVPLARRSRKPESSNWAVPRWVLMLWRKNATEWKKERKNATERKIEGKKDFLWWYQQSCWWVKKTRIKKDEKLND